FFGRWPHVCVCRGGQRPVPPAAGRCGSGRRRRAACHIGSCRRRPCRRRRRPAAATGRREGDRPMVKRIVAFALYQPLFLALLTALFIAGGIVAFEALPVEAFPDVTDIQTTVVTLFPGHAAEEVEKQ